MKHCLLAWLLAAALMMLVTIGQARAEEPYNTEWIRQLGTTSRDEVSGASADGSGNVYISGYTPGSLPGADPNAGSSDVFVVKYNSAGELQWTRQLGTADNDVSPC